MYDTNESYNWTTELRSIWTDCNFLLTLLNVFKISHQNEDIKAVSNLLMCSNNPFASVQVSGFSTSELASSSKAFFTAIQFLLRLWHASFLADHLVIERPFRVDVECLLNIIQR